MPKTLVVLQPSYLPWIGYFDQLIQSDVFIFYDDVQYTKNDWRNRNRIKTPQGAAWLTVPVDTKNRVSSNLLIKDTRILPHTGWGKRHLKTLRMNYARAPFFSQVWELLEPILTKDWAFLLDLDVALIQAVSGYLGVERPLLFSSETDTFGLAPVERLVRLCKTTGADRYLTGDAARSYLREEAFSSRGIDVSWHAYDHPRYPQLWGDFVSHLSVLDLLFNTGKDGLQVLRRKNSTPE